MYWDSENQKLISYPPKRSKEFPGWIEVDCHCCGGFVWWWGYECSDCGGIGMYYVNEKSGRIKLWWPGGPFHGSYSKLALKGLTENCVV